MSKYEFDDDHHDDYEDKEHHDDDVIPTPTPTPEPTPSDSIVRVVINQPEVNIINNTTVIENEINNIVINPPSPEPHPPQPTTNYIYGTRNNDYLTGTVFNDVIYGYQGNDTLIDGGGADKLYGAKGKNNYYCIDDTYTDFIYVKRDNKVDLINSINIDDRIDIKGSKFTFAETNIGIEIYYNHNLQAVYTGKKLSLNQIQSITI